ncbi:MULTISPECIES: ester cyclase [Deinococcus]|uniref:Ester cyclase n=1 Tax=Deinococcus rufus TaxID=2136097 RepID=A0ABV7ZBS8_9DEIO|nr:ester cyclase [Deinococcus sp. AB2017081]WQE97427.1 ester cyclase [Deinococcus sp. AB2017081]
MTPRRPPPTSSPDAPAADPGGDVVALARRIREDRALGEIYTHYVHTAVLHSADGDHHGREGIVRHALRTLAAVPDVRLHGDELVCGAAPGGMHTSHRVLVSGHHLGPAAFGPPTGRRVHWREITQRTVVGGRVVEEWRVHDDLAVVRQLGLDAWALARTAAHAEAAAGPAAPAPGVGEVVRGRGQAAPPTAPGVPAEARDLPAVLAQDVWNARRLDLVRTVYAPDAVVRVPGGRLGGPDGVARHVLAWLAAFPDGAMHVDHVLAAPGPAATVAVRWTFQGTHTGDGRYGPPTGRRVRVPGISHLRVAAGRVQREDTVWNDFALLTQLCRPAGR